MSVCDNRLDRGAAPLPLGELETEAVEHELMLVCQDLLRARTLGREFLELVERVKRNVLVYRPARRDT